MRIDVGPFTTTALFCPAHLDACSCTTPVTAKANTS
jgi:hypothetical protein